MVAEVSGSIIFEAAEALHQESSVAALSLKLHPAPPERYVSNHPPPVRGRVVVHVSERAAIGERLPEDCEGAAWLLLKVQHERNAFLTQRDFVLPAMAGLRRVVRCEG
jgi:hypothetical protein